MFVFKTIFKNAFRHRLRSALTIVGLAVAVLAFGLLQTVITAWYAGATGASDARLITRNSISIAFPLPLYYQDRIKVVDGVNKVAFARWFGGTYKDPRNFFPQFAVSSNYIDVYDDFILSENEKIAWQKDFRGAIIGRQLAERFDFKIGDTLPLKGTIYPGNWDFTVRGIFDGNDDTKITNEMFFHWKYLNGYILKYWKNARVHGNKVGVFISTVDDPDDAALISTKIDDIFKNSRAETLTETEQAFQLGFVAMSDQIIMAIQIVSYVVILIILSVMANTMAMGVRERTSEYATMKALGFRPIFLSLLIIGESMLVAILGGGIGIGLTGPATSIFHQAADGIFPIFAVSDETIILQISSVVIVGILSAVIPIINILRIRIVDALRAIA